MKAFLAALDRFILTYLVYPNTDKIILDHTMTPDPTPTPQPTPTPPISQPSAPQSLLWDTPSHAYHSTRVLCDEMGLTVAEKNLICACIYQESGFKNTALNHNRNSKGVVTSTDYGIVQINDYWHIGPSKDFPSVAYVLANPEKAVRYMISSYQHGALRMWVSYSSGAYKQWLTANSPMWKLAN